MFNSVVKLAKPLSTDDIRAKILLAKTMQGWRILYNKDYGNQQYGVCFVADSTKASMSYIHIRILVSGEFKYEEMISNQTQNSDMLMIALGKEIEA